MRLRLRTHRLEPRTVGLVLSSGQRSADLESVYVCPCGGFALGGRDAITIDDVSTVTGTTKFVDVVVAAMRQVRSELTGPTDPHLRTIATDLHAGLLRQLCIHATRWNLPPYAALCPPRKDTPPGIVLAPGLTSIEATCSVRCRRRRPRRTPIAHS